jgi:hypothetical protein
MSDSLQNSPGQRQRKSRSYPGERDAKKLIEWLNEPDAQLTKTLANPPDQVKAALRKNKSAFLAIRPEVRKSRERVETIIGLWQSLADYIAEVVRP